MMVLDCTSCGKRIRIEDESRSGAAECPRCGHMIRLSTGAATPAANDSAPMPWNQPAIAGEVRHKRLKARHINKLAIASLALRFAGITIIIVGVFALFGRDALGMEPIHCSIVFLILGGAPLLGSALLWRKASANKILSRRNTRDAQFAASVLWTLFALPLFMVVIVPSWRYDSGCNWGPAICKSNLKQIGVALQMYAGDYNGWFPTTGVEGESRESLSILFDDYQSNARVFVCPKSNDETSTAADSPGFCLAKTELSYHYVIGLRQDAPSDMPIAWDERGNHEPGRNVLFVAGYVTWQAESDFRTLIAEAYKDQQNTSADMEH